MILALLLQSASVAVMPADRPGYLSAALNRCEDDPRVRAASIAELPERDRPVVTMLCEAYDAGSRSKELDHAVDMMNAAADGVQEAVDCKIRDFDSSQKP